MVFTKIHLLPLGVFILIPASFIVTYCIAIYLQHVEVSFPYISDTGAYAPESCIFSQLVNLVALFLAATMYIRYKQVEQHYRDHLSSESTVVLRLNCAAITVGWIGCFGVSILANFQETKVFVAHMIGALIAFGCAAVYGWLQTVMSYYVYPLLNTLLVARLRAVFSVVITTAFLTTLVAGTIAHKEFHGRDATKWYPKDGGFTAHVVSTAAEWTLVIAFDFFILTFTREMRRISLSSPQVHFLIEDHGLHTTELYHSEDHGDITQSQNSLRVNSAPATPSGDYTGRENRLITQAIIH